MSAFSFPAPSRRVPTDHQGAVALAQTVLDTVIASAQPPEIQEAALTIAVALLPFRLAAHLTTALP